MERRVLIAVFLSFLVLYGYQALLAPPPPPPDETAAAVDGTAPEAEATATPAPTAAPAPAAPDAAPADQAAPEPAAAESIAASVAEPAAREITVDLGAVEAVFTNEGARLTHWRLRDYLNEAGEPLDLVPQLVPGQPTPFALQLDDAGLNARVNDAFYQVTGDANGRVDGTAAPVTLTFEFEDTAGLAVRKTFAFEPDSYIVTFSSSVRDGDRVLNPAVHWGPGLSDEGAREGGGFFSRYARPPEAIYFLDEDVERVRFNNIAEAPGYDGTFRFAGVDDHYFIAAGLDLEQAHLQFAGVEVPGENQAPARRLVGVTYSFAAPPEGVRFFFGPKQFDLLQSIDAEFVRAIYFGIFAWLVVPLLGALTWIHGFIGNYGWSIVALTVLINIVIFPLRHKSVVSMRKMQALQPQLKAIQDRYKELKVTDPARQKMNTEIMNLYREKGVNPASGCVPMLLTMPVLFAFYSMLSAAIELRDAPFMLWIQDLSLPDPYYVTPLLMGVTMFWQQRITPSSADPTQQRVMMMMPLMFMVFFLWAPAGLVIYWFCSNLWMIGQQYFTNWMIGPPALAGGRPPAERQLKPAGEGRTRGASGKGSKEKS